jgi:hypothetical protein
MTKVVISVCHGGFSLSEAGIYRYAEIAGITLYPEKDKYGFMGYWIVPEEERTGLLSDEEFLRAPLEDRAASNKRHGALRFYDRDLKRDDSVLVQVVEELGKEANGRFASLKVVEIPDDVEWEIQEYDGLEWVSEKHRTWELCWDSSFFS